MAKTKNSLFLVIFLFLFVQISGSIFLKAENQPCYGKSEWKIVKTDFGVPATGEVSVVVPNGVPIGKDFSIAGVWAQSKAKYPNARYSIIAGFSKTADEETADFYKNGIPYFERVFFKEVNITSNTFNLKINISEDTSKTPHKFVKIQVQVFAGNDNDANAPAYLEVRIYKVPVINDLKGNVQIISAIDMKTGDYTLQHLNQALIVVDDANGINAYNTKSDENGCYSTPLPKDGGDYILRITSTKDDFFRNVKHIEPSRVDTWLPVGLLDENKKLMTNLTKLDFLASLFYGFYKPEIPMAINYDIGKQDDYANSLKRYSGDFADMQALDSDSARNEAFMRSMLYLTFMDSTFYITQNLSGEAVKLMVDAGIALYSLIDFQESVAKISKKIEPEIIQKTVTEKLNGAILELSYRFIEDFIFKMNLSPKNKKYGEAVKEAFAKMKASMMEKAGKKPNEAMVKTLVEDVIKNAVVIPVNEVILGYFVWYTGDLIGESIQKATSNNINGTMKDSWKTVMQMVPDNQKKMKEVIERAKQDKMTANWESTLAALVLAAIAITSLVLAQVEISIPAFIGAATHICILIKNLSIVTILKAAVSLLYAIGYQNDNLDYGLQTAYNANYVPQIINTRTDKTNNKAQYNRMLSDPYVLDFQAKSANYIKAIDKGLESAKTKVANDIKTSFSAISDAEDSLNVVLDYIQNRFYAVGNKAIANDSTLNQKYDLLGQRKYLSTFDRMILNLRFVQHIYQTDPAPSLDSLTWQADTVKASLTALGLSVAEVMPALSAIKGPAYLQFSGGNVSPLFPKPQTDINVHTVIKNIGDEDADSVTVKIVPDSGITLKSVQQFYYTKVSVNDLKTIDWTMTVADSTKHVGYYLIEITGKGLEKKSESFVFNLDSKEAPVGVAGENISEPFEFAINGIFPNPCFDNVTIKVQVETAEITELGIYDFLGKKILSRKFELDKGDYDFNLNLAGLPSGVYIAKLSNSKKSAIGQFQVVK